MRVLLLTLMLAVGSQANVLTNLSNALKTSLHSMLDQNKQAGQDFLNQVKSAGAHLASHELKDLVVNLAKDVARSRQPQSPAKRQLDPAVHNIQDPNEVIFNHADELKQYMHMALNASERLDHPEQYKGPIQDFLDKIDQIVANHPTETTTSAFRKRKD